MKGSIAGKASVRRRPWSSILGDSCLAVASASKWAISREFVGRTGENLKALIAARLPTIELKGRCVVACDQGVLVVLNGAGPAATNCPGNS